MVAGSAGNAGARTTPREMAGHYAHRVLRFFPTMHHYRLSWLRRDLLAGITFGAVTIPGQLATAHLAGMPPVTGLYGFVIACLVGAALSSNRHLALGVDSTVAPLLASGVLAVAGAASLGSAEYVALATATTLLAGIIVTVVGLAELAWVGDLLPKEVVTGFLGGIAIVIVVNQLPGLLSTPAPHRGTSVVKLVDNVRHLPDARVDSLTIGLVALLVLLVVPRVLPRFPTALVVLAAATALSGALDLAARGVPVLGPLPSGIPPLSMPPLDLDTIRAVLPTAIGISLIILAQTAATTRTVAAVGGFEADVARDYRAVGVSNVASGLFGSFTIDASPPSSTMLSEARGRSQVAAIAAAAVTLVLVLAATGLLEDLPMSVLSAILIYIATKIFRFGEMRATFRYSWRAFALMLTTLLGVVVLGIELGLALAVIIAFVYRAKQVARPELLALGDAGGGHWLPRQDVRATVPTGVAAYRLNGPLWFGDAHWFHQQLAAVLRDGPDKPDLLVVDATRIDDIDFTGVDAIVSLRDLCEIRGTWFAIACHLGRTRAALKRAGLDDDGDRTHLYDSVDAAVQAWTGRPRTVEPDVAT